MNHVSETLARRTDLVALAAIVLVVAAAWVYLLASPGMAAETNGAAMAGMEMSGPMMDQWTAKDVLLLFIMWAVMMVGMMLPSAAPMILLFSRVGPGGSERGRGPAPVVLFVAGYLLVWWAFSAVAAVAQWKLHSLAVLSGDMLAASSLAGGALLIAAGVYQWLPLKQVCLRHCQTPLDFITSHWREGRAGALRMGVVHGSFCVGCCWMLMGLLFAAGVMNLAWVAAISCLVLLEKVLASGLVVARVAGVALITVGLMRIF